MMFFCSIPSGLSHFFTVSIEPRAFSIGCTGIMASFSQTFLSHRVLHYANCFVIGNHILIQKNITKFRISKIKICLTIINKYGGIDIIPISFLCKGSPKTLKGPAGFSDPPTTIAIPPSFLCTGQ